MDSAGYKRVASPKLSKPVTDRASGSSNLRSWAEAIRPARVTVRVTLSKILNHKGYSTGTDTLDRLCTYFSCRIEDLVEYVSEASAPHQTEI